MEILIKEGEVKKGDKLARLITEADGTVKLVHALTKTGKVRSVIDQLLVQVVKFTRSQMVQRFISRRIKSLNREILPTKWSGGSKKTTDIVQGLPRVNSLFEVRRPR